MKHLALALAVAASLTTAGLAGPLQKTDVAADAKWLLHLDLDQLRSTPQGAYVITNVADHALATAKAVMKSDTGFELDLTKIHSLTAYGGYRQAEAVLLLKTGFDVEKVADGALARIVGEGKTESPPVGKSVQDGIPTYTLRDHMVLAARPDGTTVLGQSAEAVAKANAVLSGKTPNLTSGSSFTEFRDPQKAFFFFAAAQGFNAGHGLGLESEDGAGNNPKAKILKMTDSGRVILGQNGDQLFLNVALKAKTSAVVTQMQQVIQGLIALASLAQSDNPDVQRLADSAKVSTAGDVVDLNLTFPVDKAVGLLQSNVTHLVTHEHNHKPGTETNTPDPTNGK